MQKRVRPVFKLLFAIPASLCLLVAYTPIHHMIFGKDWYEGLVERFLYIEPVALTNAQIAAMLPGCPLALLDISRIRTLTSHCPIVIDLNADGQIGSRRVAPRISRQNIHFDFEDDNFKEQTSWITPPDGLVARDLNGNGRIDSGKELFSDQSPSLSGGPSGFGFHALQDLDSNNDQILNSMDGAWSEILIWIDADQNGASSSDELENLDSHGILSIGLDYTNQLDTRDAVGLAIPFTGSFTTTSGLTGMLAAIELEVDKVDARATFYVSANGFPSELPDYGARAKIRSLALEMVQDSTLTEMVREFTLEKDPARWESQVEDIFIRWTGAEKDTSTILNELKRYHLDTYSKLFGVEYNGTATRVNEVAMLLSIYKFYFEDFYGSLMRQTHLKDIFTLREFIYLPRNVVTVDLTKVMDAIDSKLKEDRAAGLELLGRVTRALRGEKFNGPDNYVVFRDHFLSQDPEIAWAFASAGYTESTEMHGRFHFESRTGDVAMIGTRRADTMIKMQRGNAAIAAGPGDDLVEFRASLVYLQDWPLEHYVFAGEGNNTILLDDALNFVYAGAGSDTVTVTEGVTRLDLGNGNNKIDYNAIHSRINGSAGNSHILSAGDGDDLVTVSNDGKYHFSLGEGANQGAFHFGSMSLFSGSGNDIFEFHDGSAAVWTDRGDDFLKLHAGTHTVNSGAGVDTVEITGGNHFLVFQPGGGADTIAANIDQNHLKVTLAFPFEATMQDLKLEWRNGILTIGYGEEGDSVALPGFQFDSASSKEFLIRVANLDPVDLSSLKERVN